MNKANRATVDLVCQDIRHLRGMMTAREKWIAQMEPSEATIELSRYIDFWRDFIAEIESRIERFDNPRQWVKDRRQSVSASAQPR